MPHLTANLAARLSLGLLLAACGGNQSSSAQSAAGDATTPKETPMPAATPATPAASSDPAIAQIDTFIAQSKIDTAASGWRLKVPKPPQPAFTEGKSYIWVLNTNQGEVRVKLRADVAPMHVASTIYLTKLGFYDTLTFHRVIPGFMAQGGCPTGTGRDGPAYKYAGEFSPKAKHDKPGILSMANAGPNTDGSQFFLTFVPTPFLDGKHTVFGEVISGMDVVKKLESFGSESGATKTKLTIDKATVVVE